MVFIQEASHAFPLVRWRSAIRRTVENRHEIYFAQFPHEPGICRCMDLVQTHKCSLLIMGPHTFQIKF